MDTTQNIFATREYKRSRMAYRLECSFEYFVTIFITDAFLVTLLKHIGLKDSLIGIISSFTSLAFLFQLFSVFVVQRITNTKRFVIIFHTLSQLVLMSLYLIPFLPIESALKSVLVTFGVLAAYCGNYFVTSIIYKWGNSFVDPRKRANYSAVKEMISLAGGMILTLTVGYAVDHFESVGNIEGAFIFCAAGMLIFCISDFICLLSIKNHIYPKGSREVEPLATVLKNVFSNKSFISVIILTVLWNVGVYTTVGFLGTYRLGELGFSVLTAQIINIAGNFARLIASKPFGKFSDKYSFTRGIELGFVFAAVAFMVLVFTAPGTRLLMIGYSVIYGICTAGVSGNFLNITYSYVDSRYFVQASSIRSCIGGICGFCATLLGSKLMDAVNANGNKIFGIEVYSQQIMGLISFTFVIIAIIFTHFVLAKQKTLLQ